MACSCIGVGFVNPMEERPSSSWGSNLKSENVKICDCYNYESSNLRRNTTNAKFIAYHFENEAKVSFIDMLSVTHWR